MAETFRPTNGWGPDKRRAALSITFDNFGEAAQIQHGQWAGGEVGKHYTAAFLSRLIDELGETKTTYFMEASNAAIYPDAIRNWRDAGHEVGLHGWQHEAWLACPAERRTAILSDSVVAMRAIGIEPVGFRPPGGGMQPEAWGELDAAGLRYCSAAGEHGITRVGAIVSLPFEWRAVDAFMIEPVLGFLRAHMGEPEAPYSIPDWAANLERLLADLVANSEQRTVIFHPEFLALDEAKLGVLRDFLAAARRADVWIAPARDVAAFVASQTELPVSQAA